MSTNSLPLTLRSKPIGGEPVPPKTQELSQLGASRRLLLLIHGYNNDRAEANTAYAGFETLQRYFAEQADYAPGSQVVRVYWPGDADWGIASFLFFMGAVKNAEKSGELLARALETHANGEPLWVDVVAHSLGCRVTYEMLAALSPNSPVRINRIVFFAAAVATFMLEPSDPQKFVAAYRTDVTGGLLSLYSDSDMVLSVAFPLGSTLAPGPQGIMPIALGHALWASLTTPLNFNQAENRHAGHSDYWGWKSETIESNGKFANQQARDFFRFSTGTRRLPQMETYVRAGAEVREVARRETAKREVVYDPLAYAP